MQDAHVEEALLRHYDDPHREWSHLLARYVAGDLSGAEADEFERHRLGCPVCQELVAEFNAAVVHPSAKPARRWGFNWLAPGLALALAAVLVVVVRPDSTSPKLTPKGAFDLVVGIERGGESERAEPGGGYQAGDRLGFFVSTPSAGYIAIAFVDATGSITSLYPAEELGMVAVAGAFNQKLPAGGVLDPTPDCEWVVAVFSEEEIPGSLLQRDLQQGFEQRRGCRLALDPTFYRVFEVRQ